MANPEKMTSRELGLVLAQQLLDVQDLHYGLWDSGLEPTLGNLASAQQRYTDMLLGHIERLLSGCTSPRILDVGCGTGHMLTQLLACGYRVDAVNPSPYLNKQVHARLAGRDKAATTLFETGFESLPFGQLCQRYDLLLFSESFQYVPLPQIFETAPRLLKTGGQIVACDFFKTAAHCDGAEGDRSFSGGHVLSEFYRLLREAPFELVHDEDLTTRVSPNIALIDTWLTRRLVPAASSVNQYLYSEYPRLTRLFKWLLRHKLERVRYKYLSGYRSQAVFEKYKSYRLLVLRLGEEPARSAVLPDESAADSGGIK